LCRSGEAALGLKAAAFAERAWSAASPDFRPRFTPGVRARLAHTRCRLLERGFSVAPHDMALVSGVTSAANPPAPGSCLEQRRRLRRRRRKPARQ
jgi:hypothetical protein